MPSLQAKFAHQPFEHGCEFLKQHLINDLKDGSDQFLDGYMYCMNKINDISKTKNNDKSNKLLKDQ